MSSHLLQKQPWTSGSTLQRRPLRYLLYPEMGGCSPSLSEQSDTGPFVAADLFCKNTLFVSPCIHTSSRRGRFGNCSFMETVRNTAYLRSFLLLWDRLQSALFIMASWMWSRARGRPNLQACLAVASSRFQKSFCAKGHVDHMWLWNGSVKVCDLWEYGNLARFSRYDIHACPAKDSCETLSVNNMFPSQGFAESLPLWKLFLDYLLGWPNCQVGAG